MNGIREVVFKHCRHVFLHNQDQKNLQIIQKSKFALPLESIFDWILLGDMFSHFLHLQQRPTTRKQQGPLK